MKYTLLKDLPTHKAGSVWEALTNSIYPKNSGEIFSIIGLRIDEIENFSEWFSEIKEETDKEKIERLEKVIWELDVKDVEQQKRIEDLEEELEDERGKNKIDCMHEPMKIPGLNYPPTEMCGKCCNYYIKYS